MAARSVLHEIDQLRSMLRPDGVKTPYGSDTVSSSYAGRPYTAICGTTETSVDRLGRAIEAAEEEVEAALRRTEDVHRSHLRHRELEIAELQRVVAAKDRAVEDLRSSLAATKRGYEQKVADLEAALSARDAELSTLHAEVLALRAEREDLRLRCQQGVSGISRLETELRDRTAELSSTLRAKAEEAGQAGLAAARERKEKELLMLEVVELRKELEGLEQELAAAQQQAAQASDRAQAEHDGRRDVQVALEKAQAAALVLQETKDLEIAELRRRLKVEHSVRKACEKWLKSELRSREEMEGLLLAVRDVSLGSGTVPAACSEVQQVEALLAQLGEARTSAADLSSSPPEPKSPGTKGRAGSLANRLLQSELKTNQHRTEFAKLKAALGEESRRLKSELTAAKQLLRTRMHEGIDR